MRRLAARQLGLLLALVGPSLVCCPLCLAGLPPSAHTWFFPSREWSRGRQAGGRGSAGRPPAPPQSARRACLPCSQALLPPSPPNRPLPAPTPGPPGAKIVYTYDVYWDTSDITWSSRWDAYLRMPGGKVHWFSILNSLMVVVSGG